METTADNKRPYDGPVIQEMRAARKARAEEMAEKYMEGATLQEIGDYYGITRERVRQLLKKELGMNGSHGGVSLRAIEKREAAARRRDQKCIRRHGLPYGEIKAIKAEHGYAPFAAYTQQRNNARIRGIDWLLTFAEWWGVWSRSGKWSDRGRGRGKYVMARHGDSGPYQLGNVKIVHFEDNNREYIRRYWKDVRNGKRSAPKIQRNGRYDSVRALKIGDQTQVVSTGNVEQTRNYVWFIGRDMGRKFSTKKTGAKTLLVTRIK